MNKQDQFIDWLCRKGKYPFFQDQSPCENTKTEKKELTAEQDMAVDMEIKDAKENPQHYIGYEEEELENWGYGSEDKLADLRPTKEEFNTNL